MKYLMHNENFVAFRKQPGCAEATMLVNLGPMRWLKPNLVTSLYALLGHAGEPSAESLNSAVDRIRDAMEALLGEQGRTDHPWLARRLRHATELQTLWYARSDLLSARAAVCGEVRARREVEEITRLFNGLVPSSLKTRRRRLPG